MKIGESETQKEDNLLQVSFKKNDESKTMIVSTATGKLR